MGSPTEYLAAFNQFYITWQSSGFDDPESPRLAARALYYWLGEFPKDAADIQRIALGAAYTASTARRPDVALAMTAVGREASIMRPLVTDEDAASAALLGFLEGDAKLASGERNRDTSLFDEAQWLLEKLSKESPFRRYLVLHQHAMIGRVAASCLESKMASEHLWRAIEVGVPLLHDRQIFLELARQWQALVWGNVSDLIPRRAAAALGSACGAQSVEAARKCLEVCGEIGCLEGPAFQLRPAVLGVPAEERLAAIEAIRARLPKDASANSWELLLETSAAVGLLRDGDGDGALALSNSLGDRIESCHDASTYALVIADRLLVNDAMNNTSGETSLKMHEVFATGVHALGDSPHLLQYKAIFDEHFADAIRIAAQNFEGDDMDGDMLALSVLLDAIRSPEIIAIPDGYEAGSIDDGLANAANLLGRIEVALEEWPDMGVIITQGVGDDTLYVTSRSGEPFRVAWAGIEYRRASRELAQQARQRNSGRQVTDYLRELGEGAFAALPEQVRQVIRDCEHLVVVPDLAAEAAGVPYELYHDGQEALGIGKAIARVQSLRRLVDLLEAPVLAPAFRYRGATIAVPEAEGLPSLVYAKAEVNHAAKFFTSRGWECPDFEIDNLTAQGLLDALELADFVHIAAHGEVGVGRHSIVLTSGRRLSLDDIEAGNRLFHAGVFLNTCSLGQAEFLGAGLSRGVANALGWLGAPVVIANLLPVQDPEAARVARDFYEFAAEYNVGHALALARKAAADRGVPPTTWGGVVLVGNPAFDVLSSAATTTEDVVTEMLSSYVDVEATVETRGTAYTNAMQLKQAGRRNPRLNAALSWVDHASRLQPPDIDRQELDAVVRLAAALNHPEGEALMRFVGTEHFEGREALEAAANALTRVASHRDHWQRALSQVLAKLNRMDTPAEVPVTAGGVSVNDMSDPAVAAAWDIIRSQDQGEIQRIGTAELKRPETDLHSIAWNAIVLGKHGRFDSLRAARAFADHLVDKLVETEHIDVSSEVHAQRMLAALLYYLWTTQRRHHLDWDRAAWQTAALEHAVDRVSKHWTPPSLPAEYAALEIVESTANACLEGDADMSAKALRTATKDALAALDDTWKDVAADCAAWLMGLIVELGARPGDRATPEALALLSELYRDIDKDADLRFDYYRQKGMRSTPSRPNHFLEQWRAQGAA
jgi:CHAT domain-containing protein